MHTMQLDTANRMSEGTGSLHETERSTDTMNPGKNDSSEIITTKSDLIDIVLQSVPFKDCLTGFDTALYKDAVLFSWRGRLLKIDLSGAVEEFIAGAFKLTDVSILIRQSVRRVVMRIYLDSLKTSEEEQGRENGAS